MEKLKRRSSRHRAIYYITRYNTYCDPNATEHISIIYMTATTCGRKQRRDRHNVANLTDPYTMLPVDKHQAFYISASGRGLFYALSPTHLAESIFATGDARCPYTRRYLSETEVLRLDRELRVSVGKSCWYVVACGGVRRDAARARALEDALFGLEIFAADATDGRVPLAYVYVCMRQMVCSMCRQFGHVEVARAMRRMMPIRRHHVRNDEIELEIENDVAAGVNESLGNVDIDSNSNGDSDSDSDSNEVQNHNEDLERPPRLFVRLLHVAERFGRGGLRAVFGDATRF